jgi:hypothetical protein
MFYIYDLILIRQASFGNYLQVKNGYWDKASTELAKLSGDDLHRAAEEFKKGQKISNPSIYSLITNMRIISSFNPESFGEKMRFRNLIFGKIGRLGIPLIWFTLNPKDIGNIFVVKLAGEEISLDSTGLKSVLLQMTLKNPSLVAQYFHEIVSAFFSCFFKTLSKEPGIFGTVTSHFGVVESTTRMMLHLHGFAWLAGNFGAVNLSQRLTSDPPFKDRVLTYIRSIVRETVDISLGQQFMSDVPGFAVFTIPDNMSTTQFQGALDTDSNNVAARVQMHTHTNTCTKYQKKSIRSRSNIVPTVQSEGMATDIRDTQQTYNTQRPSLFQLCRFLFPRPLVPESIVTEEGYIRMERNHQFVNKYNPVISSAIRCNHDINFTPSSPKVLAAVYYMTNYATKAQTDRGQLVLAAAILKKAQEVAEAKAAEDSGLSTPPPLDMSKFALKAYNRFTKDTEVGAPSVAHFLLGQPSAYIPKGDKSVTINFHWVKVHFRKALNDLLNGGLEEVAETANQYVSFDGRTRRPSLYENYEQRGARLKHLCFYEYASQIFVQTFKGASGRVFCFPFDVAHPLHSTHIQVSVGSGKALRTPSLCGSFTSISEHDNAILDTTMTTQDEVHEVLLGLFYPWDKLRSDFQGQQLESLRASEYKNTWLWNLLMDLLPPYLLQLSENILLLRRSKEAADRDRKERGIEFDDYLETMDQDLYNDDEEANIGIDFATLHPTENNLLQAALAFPGISNNSISSLQILLNPPLLGQRFCTSSLVKTWVKELRAYKEQESSSSKVSNTADPEDPFAALIPVLGYSTECIASLPVLQASFQDNPTIDCLLCLLTGQFPLNLKQGMVVKALFRRILCPIPIKSVDDQFLLYLGGVGGVGKTYLIKAFIFGISIIHKEDDVLLTASTGAAASNVGGATYHSVLGLFGSQSISQATKSRLSHKKIWITDEISMVSLEEIVRLNKQCDAIWDLNRSSNTVFGGIPILIFLGDFNQFKPVRGHAIWSLTINDNPVLQSAKDIWGHFTNVIFLTEQMRQAEDIPFQELLQRARSATLTEDDVITLNSCTVAARVEKGETPPDRSVIRLNRLREEVNLSHLEIFAKKRGQKIYLFPARHDAPTISNIDPATLLKLMFQVGEAKHLKGPGFFAFTKGMPLMLLQNTNTSAGLVNGMIGSAEEVVLDRDVQGIYKSFFDNLLTNILKASWLALDSQYILCTVPLLCVLVRPAHDHTLSFTGLPDKLIPVFPIQMRGEIPSMPGLPFNRHQVPLTLAFAITDYKCQGGTFLSLILDLVFYKQRGVDQHKKWTSLNVQLGRLKTLSGVWLREPITLDDISGSPHPDLQVELTRLEALEQKTISLWNECLDC